MNREASIEQQIKCVSREIKLRKTCYPKWVKKKRMSQEQADAEIAKMESVLETLQGIRAKKTQEPLPGFPADVNG